MAGKNNGFFYLHLFTLPLTAMRHTLLPILLFQFALLFSPSENGDVNVERFYSDSMLSEHDALRIGKILMRLP